MSSTAPGVRPPGLSRAPAAGRIRRPGAALAIAIAGYLVGAAVLLVYAGFRGTLTHLTDWQLTLADLGVLVPLVAAVIVAGARRVIAPARPLLTVVEALAALALGLAARAVVEVLSPTTGSLAGPFGGAPGVALIAASLLSLVIVSPVVEELFFRGLVQRGLEAALTSGAPRPGAPQPAGRGIRLIAAVIAIVVTTAAFVGLHTFTAPAGTITLGQIAAPVAVGIVCGILTTVTGRVGGAVIAHIVFNAAGFALLFM